MATVITAHTGHAGQVLGVHGGDGPMSWLRAATGSHLYGDWDGVEWVGFEPGGRAGLHTHSHTEEIWFFLRGTGDIELNGTRHRVGPGSLVLTPLHSNHAAWNTGGDRLEYVVIEVFPPAVRDKLPRRRPSDELPGDLPNVGQGDAPRTKIAGGLVTRLEADTSLDARPYFDGGWQSLARRTLLPTGTTTFAATRHEQALVVMSGTGILSFAGSHDAYTPGSVITLGWDARVDFDADTVTELFVTSIEVYT